MTATSTTAAPKTVRDALEAYFTASGFDESSYTDDWVDIRIGPVPFRFPNTEGRKRALPLHDLHHALTGYPATFSGEVQIGAWEIGGGVGRHWIGWLLDLLGLSWGAIALPRTAFRAFVRGRRSRNLYREPPEPGLLEKDLVVARERLGIHDAPPAQPADYAAFAGWWLVSLIVGAAGLAATPGMILLGAWGLVGWRRGANASGVVSAE